MTTHHRHTRPECRGCLLPDDACAKCPAGLEWHLADLRDAWRGMVGSVADCMGRPVMRGVRMVAAVVRDAWEGRNDA